MISIVLVSVNQMRDECARKTKQTLFVHQSRYKYWLHFVFFQDYGTFFICKGEGKPKRFY